MKRSAHSALVALVLTFCIHGFGQTPDREGPAIPIISESAADFDVNILPGKGFMVRRKGTEEWLPISKLSEPVAVGVLDSDHKIYVVTKSVTPPKGKHTPAPEFPKSERKSMTGGQALLHVVVDDKGMVRLPTVDSSTNPEYAKAAIKAVNKWSFEPAKLNGQPVAVLISVEMDFKRY